MRSKGTAGGPPESDAIRLRRRSVLMGLGAAGMAAGCSGSGEGPGTGPAPAPEAVASATGQVVASLSELPDGRTTSLQDPVGRTLLLLRTGPGTVVALNARCTHQGCTVAAGEDSLDCPCHGSRYQPGTGAVLAGPARRPLATVPVSVRDGQVVLA